MSKTDSSIQSWQMAVLLLSFMTGSAIINVPAPITAIAKHGAWISIMMAVPFCLLLVLCLVYLQRCYPGQSYVEYGRQAVGRVLNAILAVGFSGYVIIMISYIVIDIGGFFNTTMMKMTPPYMFHSLILLSSALTVRLGLKTMSGIVVVYFVSMVAMIALVLLLVLPYYKPAFLLPLVPPEGFKPVLHGAYYLAGFPYAEVCLFAMLLKKTDAYAKPLRKQLLGAILLNGILLMLAVLCTVMATGPLASEMKYSLYQLGRMVNVQDIIERIESVISFSLIAGSYMKTTIALYIASLTLSDLFRLRNDRLLAVPLACFCFFLTMVMFDGETEFTEKVFAVWPLYGASMVVLPLLLITAVTWIRSRLRPRRAKGRA